MAAESKPENQITDMDDKNSNESDIVLCRLWKKAHSIKVLEWKWLF